MTDKRSKNPPGAIKNATFAARSAQETLARAIKKVIGNDNLTREEQQALKRHEKEKEERLRWQYYRSIPQKHWREMSGRQTKVLQEQADRYGLPFGGATVDLPALARALHDFLAENALKLAREDDDPLLNGGTSSPALERYREERAALARLDRLERERVLIPRDRCREALGRVAAILRSAGDTLGRQFGPGATELLYEALDDATREVERSFGEGGEGDGAADDRHDVTVADVHLLDVATDAVATAGVTKEANGDQ
jgi:hypothetical protein